jgi:hypothetical protein
MIPGNWGRSWTKQNTEDPLVPTPHQPQLRDSLKYDELTLSLHGCKVVSFQAIKTLA